MIRVTAHAVPSLPREGTLVLFSYEKTTLTGPGHELAKKDGFEGKTSQLVSIHDPKASHLRTFFVGLGPQKEATMETIRRAVALAVRQAIHLNSKSLYLKLPVLGQIQSLAQAATEGALLGGYRYVRYRTQNVKPIKLETVVLIAKNSAEAKTMQHGIDNGRLFSDATNFARDIINQPPSDTDPASLIRAAKTVAKGPIRLKIFGKSNLVRMGMGGILGVNRGSGKAPAFLHFIYRPKGRPKRRIGICGKGITFDSGGLSLKPPKSMETMKLDMSGAAAVFAVFKALAILKPAVEVHGFTPLTENMPGCNAQKPGDILKTYNGKTIEVLNTDAEGRLVLADALGYASRQSLDEVLDLATLTGACVVALGNDIAGIMGTDKTVLENLKKASEISGEKIWELPLEKEYRSHIESPIADVKNIGRPGEAGTIIGGLFLQEFVKEGMPWAHIDIAGPAFHENPTALAPAGGTGVMVRTLLHYILSHN